MNDELKTLVNWLRANKLSLNETKTELIIFHSLRKNRFTEPNIMINNLKLTPQKFVTYLGIIIDETLSWNKQIETLCTRLSRTNGILSKLRYYIPLETTISVYYSLFHSYVTYGSLVWSYTSQKNLEKLFKLQKKCVRIITFSNYHEHTAPLFASLNLLKLEDIFQFQILKLIYFFYNDRLPTEIKNLFTISNSVHSHITRGHQLLFIPNVITTHYGKSSLKYNAPFTWNNFARSNEFVNYETSISNYKKLSKAYYVKNYL